MLHAVKHERGDINGNGGLCFTLGYSNVAVISYVIHQRCLAARVSSIVRVPRAVLDALSDMQRGRVYAGKTLHYAIKKCN